MGQVKIYGLKSSLFLKREAVSDLIHSAMVKAFELPQNKRFHRFLYLEHGDFFYPDGRSQNYTILEISMFEGRSIEAKKLLYSLLYKSFEEQLAITHNDLEITLTETPKYNWGIRGKSGDELELDYTVTV